MPTLTRQELYDLVWSTPMTKAAQDLDLSDVGLSKVCARHRVPTPPRGYWARKAAGKKVKQAIFVPVDDPLLDKVQISPQRDNLPEPVRAVIEQRRAERKALARPIRQLTTAPPVSEPVADPHPTIRATALVLRRTKPSQSGDAKAIGAGLCGVSVSGRSVERVIFILHQLANACDARGLALSPTESGISSAIGQDSVTFEIKEKTKQVPHVLTPKEIAEEESRRKRHERLARGRNEWDNVGFFAPDPPKFDTVRTGELSIEVHGWGDGLRRAWRDGKTQVIETMIPDILDGLEAHIIAARHRREKCERAQAERNELERRRSLAKARRERDSGRKTLLNKLIHTERKAAQLLSWIEAQEQRLALSPDSDLIRMVEWARNQLKQLEAILDPVKLADSLRAQKLFPEVDELNDPLGEPPAERRWW